MSRSLGNLVTPLIPLVLIGAVGTAAAERPRPVLVRTDKSKVLPPVAAGAPSSRLIYMHRCPQQGCVIRPGMNNSTADTSSIPDQQVTLTKFRQSDAVWTALMKCMRETYAPFNIGVIDVDPGNVPHYENIVGGKATELSGDLAGAGGVSPFTCDEIPNAISFTFDVYGPDADALCWTAAQETAHAFGLEHEYNAADPMTYLAGGPSKKRFQAMASPCGEYQAQTCECTDQPTQSSYQMILDLFGPGAPTAPTISITAPTVGTQVQPRFVARVKAFDDVAIDRVEMWIDGQNTGASSSTPPYTVIAPDTIEPGPHTLELKAFDVQGTPASAVVEIEMGPPCTASKGCTGVDVCVMGVCVPGPEQAGGLGSFCTANTECISGKCIQDSSSGSMACVESCDGSSGSCPEDFSCIQAGSDGVCWHTPDGGCCDASGNPTGPLVLAGGVLLVAMRRRRPRSSSVTR